MTKPYIEMLKPKIHVTRKLPTNKLNLVLHKNASMKYKSSNHINNFQTTKQKDKIIILNYYSKKYSTE